MSLNRSLSLPATEVSCLSDLTILSGKFARRYQQKIACHLLAVCEAGVITLIQALLLFYYDTPPLGGLGFTLISAIGVGAIALASALWTGAATFDRLEYYSLLLPGAVATAIFSGLAALAGGAPLQHIALCTIVLFAAVFLVRIPTILLVRWLLSRGRLVRLVAVVADDPLELEAATAALAPRSDIVIVFSGPPNAFDSLRHLSQEGLLDEIVLAGPHVLTEDLQRMATLATTLVRAAPSDRFEQRAVNALRGRPQSQWNVQAAILVKPPQEGWAGAFKRVMDVIGSLCAIVLLSPLIFLCAVAIKLESRGPVLFIQERAGLRNRPFRMFKFRSMYTDRADLTGSQLTLRNDSRVTRIGKLLRSTSIDELPQLFNVLRGEMSLVGPRPHPKGAKAGGILYDELIPAFYSRYRAKPGITGLAQVSGQRGNTETQQQLIDRYRSDLRYIEEWTPFLDIAILFRTVGHLLKRTNAY